MAMSSLSAQLAGLSGQTQPTNRRREDAIGRGIAHSTQVGYSLHAPSSKYKPSVLYDDAKAASDVPLTTLRENALSSLNQLTRVTGSDAFVSRDYIGLLMGKTSVSWERRVSSKSDVVQRDKLCEKMLGLLCTVWGEDENSDVINQAQTVSDISGGVTAFAAGLHVLEYLLRLYSVHLHLPQALVLCVLPAHETPLFNRVLQLIDLAEMPSYLFLRPFAAPGAETLPRGAIAKKAAGDDALVASLCKLAKDAARIHSIDVPSSSGADNEAGIGPVQPRQGVSRLISFAAAVLVEALDIQTTAGTSVGSAKEPTVRVILPYVLGACCGNEKERGTKNDSEGKVSLSIICPDFRSWGYVMASALVAKCPAIAPEVREVIATTISKGALEMTISLGHGPQFLGESDNEQEMTADAESTSLEAVEEMTTSLLALLSVLSDRSSEGKEQLAILTRVSNTGASKNRDLIGLNMPVSTFRPLAQLSHLTPVAFGEVIDSQGLDITDALASLFVRSFDYMLPSKTNVGKKSAKKIGAKRGEALRLILVLFKESSLKKVWTSRSNGLTASVSSHIVVSFASSSFDLDDADSQANAFLDNCKLVLRKLRSVDAIGCDAGIAHAVALLKGGKRKRKKEAARRIELLIGTQAPTSANPAGDALRCEPMGQGASDSAAGGDEFARLLPARVALEHPDASIRLHAVKRLLDDVETAALTETDGDSSLTFDSNDAVDVCRSLMRRFLADDDSGVAAAAAGAIRRLVAEDIVREEEIFGNTESIQSVISGLLKWSVLDDVPSKASLFLDATDSDQEDKDTHIEYDKFADKLESQPPSDPIEAMCCALALAGLAASTLLNAMDDEDVYSPTIESEGEFLRVLLVYICAHLDITSDGLDEEKCINACELIHDAAASALIHAIADDNEEDIDSICDIQEKASQHIRDNENCLAVLLRSCFSRGPSSENAERIDIDKTMERRYMWACLFCMSEGVSDGDDKTKEGGVEDGVGGSCLEQNILTVIHHILEMSGENDDLTDREAAALLGHLVPCFASIINHNPSMLPAALIDLCTLTSPTAYDKVSRPGILYLFGATDADGEAGESAATSNLSPVAIMLEAASRYGVKEIAVTRLISIACVCMSEENILSRQENIANGLVQALSLLSHSSQSVRATAIEFISNMASLQSKMPTICDHLPDAIESLKSSLMMDGGALPNFLAEIVAGSDGSSNEARKDLLKHCVVAAIGTTLNVEEGFSFGDYLGGLFSTYKTFRAMKEAGESAFPLFEKWDKAGHALFEAFLSPDVDIFSDRYADVEMHPIKSLCESVAFMLKGVISSKNSEPSLVISTGPAKSGRRARTYSVGAGDDGGLITIDPYPDTMSSALSEFLSGATERIDEPYVRLMYNAVAHCVLGSQTWAERIFPRLKVDARRTIASALLQLRSQREIESAGAALSNLQIDESDVCYLFESEFASSSLALTCVADSIRSRATALAGSNSALTLSTLLFDKLTDLSRQSLSDGGYEYVRLSLLQALISLHEEMTKQKISLPKKKSTRKKGGRARSQSDAVVEKFAEQATLLVALVGNQNTSIGSNEVHPVRSHRGRALVLSLLTTLCSQAPGAVVGSLIPALGNILSLSSTSNETSSLAASQALRAIVPAYCTHGAASGFSFAELVDAFIASCYTNNTRPFQRSDLCKSFADALVAVETTQEHGQAIASFVGSLVAADAALLFRPQELGHENAMEVDNNDEMEEDSLDAVALSIEVLGRAPTTDQVVASLQIVQHVSQMIELLGNSSDSNTDPIASALEETSSMKRVGDSAGLSYAIGTHGLFQRATATIEAENGGSDKRKALISLTTNLLYVIRDLFSFSSIKKVIKNNEGKSLNNVCLSLWQELVQLQSNSLRHQAMVFAAAKSSSNELLRDEKEFWEGIPGAAEECLDLLQRVLPVPDYLASVTNLLQDDETEAPLFVRTAELLSERADEIDPYSHEATLFLEVVPELVTMLRRPVGDDAKEDGTSRHQVTIKQASLMAIERLAQALCLATGDERVFKKASTVLLAAMKEVTVLITTQSTNLARLTDSSSSSHIQMNDGEIQLLSTAALCASTLVAVLRARCLSVLAKLVKPVISSLASINLSLMKCSDLKHKKSSNLSQLALLRTLVSVAETLPQFAVPYLSTLFAPSALPSRMLRSDDSEDDLLVANMTDRLDRALAKRTPARQIIPAASKAVAVCLSESTSSNADAAADAAGWQEAKALLSILKSSVECTSRAELTPVVGKLLNAILISFKYGDDEEGQQELLSAANKTLLALVLKLSEAQLRPLYARIREWRGDLDETSTEGDDAEEAATKRYAFWSMSALLSRELRSIFLPCLSSVLPDAIKELEFAVKKHCTPDLFSKKDGGKKRRRLEESGESSTSRTFKSLQPILLCLESALRADAHDGGNWIRGDDGQRHALILEPLGKLLQAKLPSDMPVATIVVESNSMETSPYESLIQGIGTLDYGSVSRCIVALAMAAGDERMWKPINHALLQACENNDRAEVRRAGVYCLKSVMESIGEEYMVLLPECLPALSELLEDEDEDIAGLARECVTLGEELLGESLEDSLR